MSTVTSGSTPGIEFVTLPFPGEASPSHCNPFTAEDGGCHQGSSVACKGFPTPSSAEPAGPRMAGQARIAEGPMHRHTKCWIFDGCRHSLARRHDAELPAG